MVAKIVDRLFFQRTKSWDYLLLQLLQRVCSEQLEEGAMYTLVVRFPIGALAEAEERASERAVAGQDA